MEHTTVSLGSALDVDLRVGLREVLDGLGANGDGNWWAVGSPGEPELAEVRVGPDLLTVEGEPYVGLTISGPTELVGEVYRKLAARSMGI